MKHSTYLWPFMQLLVLLIITMKGTTSQPSCPQHEYYAVCGPNCQTECSTLHQPCLIRYIRCPSGCYCHDGYARNAAGSCIPIEQCPK